MRLYNLFKSVLLISCILLGTTTTIAGKKIAYLIDYDNVNEITNENERAAAWFFSEKCVAGDIITPNDINKINPEEYTAIWIHIDRIGLEKGYKNLPSKLISTEMLTSLKNYVNNGGNLYLTKFATQLLVPIERISDKFAPNIFGAGTGSEGSDVWSINAQIGFDNIIHDPSQYYDHQNHPIYKNLGLLATGIQFPYDTFPMEGPESGSTMWREDHNCIWDLNGYTYSSEGRNVVEKFQNETNSLVLGTWGHVKDYAVAGVVEFLPTASCKGKIIALGLSACEWSPKFGKNKYQANFEKFTENCLNYLIDGSINTGVEINSMSDNIKVYGIEDAINLKNVDRNIAVSIYGIDGTLIKQELINSDSSIGINTKGIILVEIQSELEKRCFKVIIK